MNFGHRNELAHRENRLTRADMFRNIVAILVNVGIIIYQVWEKLA